MGTPQEYKTAWDTYVYQPEDTAPKDFFSLCDDIEDYESWEEY